MNFLGIELGKRTNRVYAIKFNWIHFVFDKHQLLPINCTYDDHTSRHHH